MSEVGRHRCVVPGVGFRDSCGLVAGQHAVTRLSNIRCLLDGVDVTSRAKACCVVGGWIDLYAVDAWGAKYVRDGQAAIDRHYGRVEVNFV